MRIGIISDTHDRHGAVAEALRLLAAQQVELILHCGDIESPETVLLFMGTPTHFVLGNCDTNPTRLAEAIAEIDGTLHEPYGQLELAGQQIAWLHGHHQTVMRELEQSNRFDYLFYGHSHQASEHQTGKTRVINPGAMTRVQICSCLVLDLSNGETRSLGFR